MLVREQAVFLRRCSLHDRRTNGSSLSAFGGALLRELATCANLLRSDTPTRPIKNQSFTEKVGKNSVYQAWIVITADGRIHRGLQLDHKSGGAIALITEDGDNAYFKADEIEEYEASPSSLMPSGLSETMSVNEFQDLIGFLESQK